MRIREPIGDRNGLALLEPSAGDARSSAASPPTRSWPREHETYFAAIFESLRQLAARQPKPKRQVGFAPPQDKRSG